MPGRINTTLSTPLQPSLSAKAATFKNFIRRLMETLQCGLLLLLSYVLHCTDSGSVINHSCQCRHVCGPVAVLAQRILVQTVKSHAGRVTQQQPTDHSPTHSGCID